MTPDEIKIKLEDYLNNSQYNILDLHHHQIIFEDFYFKNKSLLTMYSKGDIKSIISAQLKMIRVDLKKLNKSDVMYDENFTTKTLEAYIEKHNVLLKEGVFWEQDGEMIRSTSLFVNYVYNELNDCGVKKVTKEAIMSRISIMRDKIFQNGVDKLTTDLAYDEKLNKDAILNEFCKNVIKCEDKTMMKYHSLMIQQMIWLIKRKVRLLPTIWEVIIQFYGKTGSGKSYLTEQLCKPFSQLGMETTFADMSQMNDPERFINVTRDNFVVRFDDAGHSNDTDKNIIKHMVTSDKMSARAFHTQDYDTIRKICTFITTSNAKLNLSDSTTSRRFWHIESVDYIDRDWVKDAMKSGFFIKMWKCVDEEGECPIVPVLTEIQKIQEKDRLATPETTFFDEYIVNIKDKEEFQNIYNQYKIYFEEYFRGKPTTRNKFYNHLREYCDDNKIKMKNINNRNYVFIADLLHDKVPVKTQEDEVNEIMKELI